MPRSLGCNAKYACARCDPSGSGYHILQSKIALGSGGLLGKGYGLGSQSQLNFLPEKQTDFIFATLAEEFGFVGCASVLVLYAAVIFMALRTAYLSHSHFGRLAAAGVTITFALYVLINGSMVMGLAPVVGVPMPLLSWGGTVMITVMVGFGLVQSVRVHRYSEVTKGGSILGCGSEQVRLDDVGNVAKVPCGFTVAIDRDRGTGQHRVANAEKRS